MMKLRLNVLLKYNLFTLHYQVIYTILKFKS